jgi:hypothetical protein
MCVALFKPELNLSDIDVYLVLLQLKLEQLH